MFDNNPRPSPKTWEGLTHKQKNELLFQRQKERLDLFLEKHAISREQYDRSLRDLTERMKL